MNLQESRSSRGQLPIAYAPVKVICESIEGGGYKLRSTQKLETFDPSLAKLFRRAVESHAGRVFIAERSDDGSWRTLTYEQTRPIVDSIAQSLIERGLSAERPVLILSGNSIEHAILTLACYTAGVPVAPLSVAYSPTIYFNVPAGFAALLPYLESDTSIAKAFFARLRLIFYAAAALPQDLWSRLEEVSSRTIGHRVPMTSSWGLPKPHRP